ncbi:MAG: hypothetical protein LC659_03310, partial [Myxococcales bacterium]|nr:hypothetical protein [Myxococcales bacterium]
MARVDARERAALRLVQVEDAIAVLLDRRGRELAAGAHLHGGEDVELALQMRADERDLEVVDDLAAPFVDEEAHVQIVAAAGAGHLGAELADGVERGRIARHLVADLDRGEAALLVQAGEALGVLRQLQLRDVAAFAEADGAERGERLGLDAGFVAQVGRREGQGRAGLRHDVDALHLQLGAFVDGKRDLLDVVALGLAALRVDGRAAQRAAKG